MTIDELEERLSEPTPAVVAALDALDGDFLILGAAGKMGPTLARMAKRAVGKKRRVIAVSRFSDPATRAALELAEVETIGADLLDVDALLALPDVENIVFMAGMKFGATGNEPLTWAMNSFLPGLVCQRFTTSRIAAFSTGNVYPLTPLHQGGSVEADAPGPVGEYAQSCLGRERIFEYFANTYETPVSLLRLNYAVELRYGVLCDLARKVWEGTPISVAMAAVNVVWQGDANAWALQSLAHASSPAAIFNLAGPEQLSVRRLATQLGKLLGKEPHFEGEEAPLALLSNGQKAHRVFGYPTVPIEQVLEWTAAWIKNGGPTLGKPTKFEVRDGKF
ncbi:NAD-dependent epimerase/dehydratase family protein [Armatimonas rosea]|uniref:Nucleoside-diphosphate-sugar epimerase n=1 Tax=Armatimonas rosea TaxID=685828 RepID=A0A7W9W857_ARMRO|nr:NAD(P)-dependent oxidoreductase [Armatimonas rosea]MBB6052398.1 nucleoside-diphosphate-sugar epimerase [Armatimonas rosea]